MVSLGAVVIRAVVDLRNLPASPHFPHLHWQLEGCAGGDQLVVVVGGGGGGGVGGQDCCVVVVVGVGRLVWRRGGSEGAGAAVFRTGGEAVVVLRQQVGALVDVGAVELRVRVVSRVVLAVLAVPAVLLAVVVVLPAVARVKLFLWPNLPDCFHHVARPTEGC